MTPRSSLVVAALAIAFVGAATQVAAADDVLRAALADGPGSAASTRVAWVADKSRH